MWAAMSGLTPIVYHIDMLMCILKEEWQKVSSLPLYIGLVITDQASEVTSEKLLRVKGTLYRPLEKKVDCIIQSENDTVTITKCYKIIRVHDTVTIENGTVTSENDIYCYNTVM